MYTVQPRKHLGLRYKHEATRAADSPSADLRLDPHGLSTFAWAGAFAARHVSWFLKGGCVGCIALHGLVHCGLPANV